MSDVRKFALKTVAEIERQSYLLVTEIQDTFRDDEETNKKTLHESNEVMLKMLLSNIGRFRSKLMLADPDAQTVLSDINDRMAVV